MTDEQRQRITDLRRKLNARRGKTGFENNIREIEAEIARLEAE